MSVGQDRILRPILNRPLWIGTLIMRYAIVIEKAVNSYSAYVPDLPGCITVGAPEPARPADADKLRACSLRTHSK